MGKVVGQRGLLMGSNDELRDISAGRRFDRECLAAPRPVVGRVM